MEKFRSVLLENNWFMETAVTFSEPYPEKIRQKNADITNNRYTEVETGIRLMENGDIRFRMYAPYAEKIDVEIEGDRGPTVALNKRPDGVFEGFLAFDTALQGEQICNFFVDNTLVICPTAPVIYVHNRLANFFDLPDQEMKEVFIENVPHGTLSRELYYSESLKRWMRCFVYLPTDYSADKTYPVLYLQHGNSGNETAWMYEGKVANLMDNLLAAERCRPFLIVMNDGMVRYPDEIEGKNEFRAFTDVLLSDCIPFIDGHFSTLNNKWGRAMAGLSMGSTQTAHVGFLHPEYFGYLGLFSGCMRGMATDEYYEEYPYLAVTRDLERFQKEYKLFFRGIGDQDPTWNNFLRDDRYLEKCGITELPSHHRFVYEGQVHSWGAWRRAFCDFSELVFKDEQKGK